MRFFEIARPIRSVRATARFKREYEAESQISANMRDLLLGFLLFKETAPIDAQYGRKDAPFRHGDLKGFRHCHLVYGKRIVTYQIDATTIYLTALTDHSAYDGHNPKIAGYLKNVSRGDYTPFTTLDPTSDVAPAQASPLRRELTDLAYDLSDDHRSVLVALSQGNAKPFMVFAEMIPATLREVAQEFGTKEAMMAFAIKVLKDTAIKNGQA